MNDIYFAGRILLAVIFLIAGVPKMYRYKEFTQAVANYNILPAFLISPFALIAVTVEIIGALSLAIGYAVSISSIGLGVLLVLYTLAVSVSLYLRVDMSCHCFEGLGDSRLTPATLLRVLFLLGVDLLVVTYQLRIPADSSNLDFNQPLHIFLYLGFSLVILTLTEVAQRGFVLAQQVRQEYR